MDSGVCICGKGWEKRCAEAKGKRCTCSCGGNNHNKHPEEQKEVFTSGTAGFEGKYGLQIIKGTNKVAVIITEFPDNHGTSVTNCFERLAEEIYNSRLIEQYDPEQVVWIEHYQYDLFSNPDREDTYDLVSFSNWFTSLPNIKKLKKCEFRSPAWKRIEKKDITGLIA